MPNSTQLVLGRLCYLSPFGGRYKGRLIITPSELLFESSFDETFEVLNKNNLKKRGGKKILTLLKEDISSVEFSQSFLSSKLILSLNGKTHTFQKRKMAVIEIRNALKN